MKSTIVLYLAALLTLPATAPPALAQSWPAKPVRIIVLGSAGPAAWRDSWARACS
jgi:tripartite-type tricarboxylate transporter receptor subunit TctC